MVGFAFELVWCFKVVFGCVFCGLVDAGFGCWLFSG